MEHFLDSFRKMAQQMPDHVAIVDQNGSRETTLGALDLLMCRTAAKLESLHFPRGSFIIIRMSRCMEYIAAYYGVIFAGMAVVPTVTDYPEERVAYIRGNCESPFTIDDSFFDDISEYEPSEGAVLDPGDIVCMNYTSGSTGRPKGVYYTLRCIDENMRLAASVYDGLDEVVMGASASMAFAAVCHDCLAPMNIGGTVHLLSDELRRDIGLMMDYYEEHHLTCGNVAPRLLRFFKHTTGLKRLMTCGERVVNAWSPDHETWCIYGLTETYTVVTCFRIDRPYENTPIGKPLGGIRIEILDPDGNEVPDGKEGEINVTWYTAEGYYKMPEETARAFKDLGGGIRRYSTHDLGYRNENGDIVFVNRMDWMVKINGQRVEPSEAEEAILSVPGVTGSVVRVFEENGGTPYLCGYYTADNETVTEDVVRQAIAKKLPPYMIPSYIIRMDQFPVAISGKIDRGKLEPPAKSAVAGEYVPPENETEAAVAGAMAQVLHLGRVGRNDDFFLLGGSSIDVIELITLLDSDTLRTTDITAGRTPAKIAERIARGSGMDVSAEDACRKKSYSLTPYQMHYYRYWQYAPDVVLGNTPFLVRFDKGRTDAAALQEAALRVLKAHPAFSTCILENEDGTPVQHFDPEMIEAPEIIPVTGEEALRETAASLIRPFQLKGRPLFCCRILSAPDAEYLFLDTHHIITDHLSQELFLKDLALVLDGKEPAPDYYGSWLAHLSDRSREAGGAIVPDASCARFPAFDQEGTGCMTDVIAVRLSLTPPECSQAAKKQGAAFQDLLIAASLRAIGRYNHTSRVCVNWIYGGRDTRLEQGIAGLLLSALPVPADLKSCPDLPSLLAEVQKTNTNNLAYSILSPGFFGERPVLDDTFTVNYIPFQKGGHESGMSMMSLINDNRANSAVFYLIAQESAPDEPMRLMFKFNTAVYRRGNIRRFVEIYMEELGLGAFSFEEES